MRNKKVIERSMQYKSGVALVEVLVSIVVMSLALIGIAGLQVGAIAYQKNSSVMNKVIEISNDVAERVQANPTGAAAGAYLYAATYATAAAATLPSNGCYTGSSPCTATQVAADDLSTILQKVQTLLPGGAIEIAAPTPSTLVVTVMYMDKDFVNPATQTLANSVSCSPAINGATSDMAWRNCCPPTTAVPSGVRCRRTYLLI